MIVKRTLHIIVFIVVAATCVAIQHPVILDRLSLLERLYTGGALIFLMGLILGATARDLPAALRMAAKVLARRRNGGVGA